MNQIEFDFDLSVLVGDLHLGRENNSYIKYHEDQKFFYEFLIPEVEKLQKQNPNRKISIVFFGDQWDNKQLHSVVLQNYAERVFEDLASKWDVLEFSGNHDMPLKKDQTINSNIIFKRIPNLTLVDNGFVKLRNGKNLAIMSYIDELPQYKEILSEYSASCKYLFGHNSVFGFVHEGKAIEEKGHLKISDFENFLKVWMGHIHLRQSIKNIDYIGTPYHTRSLEWKNDVGITVLDWKDMKETYIPNNFSPRYKKINLKKLLEYKLDQLNNEIKNSYLEVLIPQDLYFKVNYNLLSPLFTSMKKLDFKDIVDKDQMMKIEADFAPIEADYSLSIIDFYRDYLKDLNSVIIDGQQILITEKMRENMEKSFEHYHEQAELLMKRPC
jgi:DNA repair exonuclease SbcCD nuclease subunit